jgi:hypothetical protein
MNSWKHRQNRTSNTHIHGLTLCQFGKGTSMHSVQEGGEGGKLLYGP